MGNPTMMTFDYQMFLVQAYRGRPAVNQVVVSAGLVNHVEDDELAYVLQLQAERLDRSMLVYCGYVDKHRLWGGGNSMDIQRHSALGTGEVYLLNGSRAGMSVKAPASKAVLFPRLNGTSEEYRIHWSPLGRVGIVEKERYCG